MVVAIDDVHWADVESSHLLERLVPLSEQAAVLFVLAGRPDRDHPSWRLRELALRELAHRSHEITLGALPGGVDAELLAALVGPDTLPDELAKRVLAAAEGNPFYVEELVRSLIGAGALVLEDGAWRFDHDVDVEIPETVEKVLLAGSTSSRRRPFRAAGGFGARPPVPCRPPRRRRRATRAMPVEAMAQLQRADLLEEARRWPQPGAPLQARPDPGGRLPHADLATAARAARSGSPMPSRPASRTGPRRATGSWPAT